MKKIPLTQGKYALVDDADFDYLNQWKWHYSPAGKGYAVRTVNSREKIYMHRIILSTPKDKYTDHINGNSLDNRHTNLRIATNQLNQANTGRQINNSTGFKGVYKSRNKWRARIHFLKNSENGGTYNTKEEAALAYNQLALKHFGEFAQLNEVR